MSELNPYASFLDERDFQEVLAATPGELKAVLQAIGDARSGEAPAPGKWSPAEILCHLADCELVFSFRLRQTLAEDHPVIQPFDQDKWSATYKGIGAEQALGVFKALRGWNLQLVRTVMPAAANRATRHPERGELTFKILLETIAGHDLNHLGQLQRIARQGC